MWKALAFQEPSLPSASWLAGFPLNASYGRFDECCKFWGETINTTRDLAGNTMMFMKDDTQKYEIGFETLAGSV
jgi:predicted membrane chloride channel (bestrophin family)